MHNTFPIKKHNLTSTFPETFRREKEVIWRGKGEGKITSSENAQYHSQNLSSGMNVSTSAMLS